MDINIIPDVDKLIYPGDYSLILFVMMFDGYCKLLAKHIRALQYGFTYNLVPYNL